MSIATPACLSVSSVGSSPLQHHHRVVPGGGQAAFSILGRIEPTATPEESGVPGVSEDDFQYPRSDRAHCNIWPPMRLWMNVELSVSSVGSSPLQRLPGRHVLSPEHHLSVSSVGSSPLQHSYLHPGGRPPMIFQYPRSDRAHCNTRILRVSMRDEKLSVSSVGSSPLQRWSRPGRRSCRPFKLSVSSVGSSPLQPQSPRWAPSLDQALSVSSVGSSPLQPRNPENRLLRPDLSVSSVGSSPLQLGARAVYPLGLLKLSVSSVGSSPLQRRVPLQSLAPLSAFSILGRIEPTATPFSRPPQRN